ncbi:hypothetical protein HKD37_20G056590 [Glycine soja]
MRRSKFFRVFDSVTVRRGQLLMASSSIITPEDVLESLMNDGTIDALRLKIINQLKANEELKSTTIKMAEQSKVLNTPGAEKQTKRELFDALRQELEASVLEKASKSVWDLILDNNGLGKEISEMVERVFCRLSGQEPPLFPLPNGQPQPDKETDNRKEKGKGKQKENENRNSNTPSKKRSFSEINLDGADETATWSSDPAVVLEAWNHWHIKKTFFFALERGKSTTTSSAVVLGRYLRENFTMVQMQILWNTPSGSLATKNLFILESLQLNEGECLQLQPYKLEEFFHLA